MLILQIIKLNCHFYYSLNCTVLTNYKDNFHFGKLLWNLVLIVNTFVGEKGIWVGNKCTYIHVWAIVNFEISRLFLFDHLKYRIIIKLNIKHLLLCFIHIYFLCTGNASPPFSQFTTVRWTNCLATDPQVTDYFYNCSPLTA